MKKLEKIRFLFLCFVLITVCFGCDSEQLEKDVPAKKYRYLICTDMTHDDDNSLIRLLHYANEIDIEAIVITDQGPETQRIEDWPNKMWEENDFESCNHDPIAGFNGDVSGEFICMDVVPDIKIILDAKGSFDPDGDDLTYKWWRYNEADSYEKLTEIKNSDRQKTEIFIPGDSKGKNIHVILEVKDKWITHSNGLQTNNYYL